MQYAGSLEGPNLRTMPGTPEDPSVKLARDLYDIRLQDLASAQLGIRKIKEWYDYFPRTDDAHPRIAHHSQHGAFATPEKLAQYVAQDFRNERHAICVVEGITLHWTVSLGVIWNLDPQFFIEHIRELSDDEYRKSLRETRAPNSGAGLRSARVGPWATVRRVVDHGDIRASLEGQQLPSKCKRRVAPTLAGSYCSHTNTSIYNVSNYLRKYAAVQRL